jgi:uncharacterized integral membrane protein
MSEPAESKPAKKKQFYTRPKFIASCIIAVMFLILMFQNWQSVGFNVFFWEKQIPAAVLYFVFALIGFVVGWLLCKSKASSKSKKS